MHKGPPPTVTEALGNEWNQFFTFRMLQNQLSQANMLRTQSNGIQQIWPDDLFFQLLPIPNHANCVLEGLRCKRLDDI